MAAIYVANLVIYTGTDFRNTFVLTDSDSNLPMNLTGYTGCAQMKRYETSVTSKSFNIIFPKNKKSGILILSMDDETTATLKPGKYFYDVLLNSPQGITSRAVEGEVLVKRSITR